MRAGRWTLGVLDLLLGDNRTIVLEWILAGSVFIAALWMMFPWWSFFGSEIRLAVPRWAISAVLFMHGSLYIWALIPPLKMDLCRRAALATAAIYIGATAVFVAMPPREMFVVPVTASLGTAAFLVYLRLGLLFR